MGDLDGRSHRRGEDGAINVLNVIVLAVVVLATGIAAIMLTRTMNAAQRINEKAAAIAQSGRGINIATDSIIQLRRTNQAAASILDSARPLEGELAEIVDLARSIDRLAASINDTAGAINGTAGTINGTAEGINAQAAAILDVGRRIDEDVRLINTNLDETIALAEAIDGDTGNILSQAQAAHRNAACIDRKVGGESGNDGHCS